jgi:4'-phosphopantetheinyl transferase EntD
MAEHLLVSSVLPATSDGLAYSELYSDPPGLHPLPEEEALIAKSVAKRRNEFITVRHCARIALGELGVPPVPILKGDKGEPCWPDGVIGSLTHCTGYRGAVVGRSEAVRSVGIDAEPHDTLPHGVLDAVSLPEERSEIPEKMPTGLHWDRILFCAKEATYKAWFPLTKRWLGFEDAHITFEPESQTAGTFVSRILIDPAALSGPPLAALQGRWSVDRGLVLTAIVL